ncbi:YciI family protein [Actinophytocola sediminis]
MSHFLYQFVPHRPDLPTTMSDAEAAVMGEHVGYWQQLVDQGVAVVFGPVADPAGAWGIAVVAADDEEDVRGISAADPVTREDLGTVHIYPMPGAIARRS